VPSTTTARTNELHISGEHHMAKPLNCRHDWVEFLIHRVGERRHVYSTCQQCGQEWSATEEVPDLGDPISSDEVISVHEQLEIGKSLKEIVEPC
jgi:hypothetical protein